MKTFIENMENSHKAVLAILLSVAMLGEVIAWCLVLGLGYNLAYASAVGMILAFVGFSTLTLIGSMLLLLFGVSVYI